METIISSLQWLIITKIDIRWWNIHSLVNFVLSRSDLVTSHRNPQVNILQNSGPPPPLAKNQPVGKNWLKNHKNLQKSHKKSCFKPIFIIIFPLFCQIIHNLAFLLQIVKKCGNLVRKFPKISSAKNERRCHGPWQKIDFLVKYSPVPEPVSV